MNDFAAPRDHRHYACELTIIDVFASKLVDCPETLAGYADTLRFDARQLGREAGHAWKQACYKHEEQF